ncbi:brevican core protein-like [Actinia tenebrosa]|uniref:Brevican core protein-like n=1 Tax=Actinia tenebrosa TaxID=6105 RepID=A0A6P8I3K1_ACTTE|nr:brevican core protein-like [Actinia tenebrosa]
MLFAGTFLLLAFIIIVNGTCSPKREEFSSAINDQVLVGPSIGSVSVPSEYVCQWQCILTSHCSMFNYGPNGECEVLDSRSQNFVIQIRTGWFFKAQMCHQDVCQNGGTCFSTSEGNATCVCKEGFTGDRCQNLPPCFDGWHHFEGKCYKLFLDRVVMSVAEQNCFAQGGHLASIHSMRENEFIYITVINRMAGKWIGYNDIASEGTFEWTDGEPSVFQYWHSNAPNNNNEQDCVLMSAAI